MPSREQILASLQTLLASATPGGLEIVDDPAAREGSMNEERRAQSHFFGHIIPKLKEKYGEMGKAEEDAAIASLVAYIESELAKAMHRDGTIVGPERARRAVTNSAHRNFGTINVNGHCAFDDIGRYHTALRALKDDSNLGGPWQTHYLAADTEFSIRTVDGRQHTHRYRQLLAYIWSGAKEDDLILPQYVAGLPLEQVKQMSRDAVITELAQNRREHNFDAPDTSGRNRFEDATDYQTCDMGFRGRLFGRMLIWNDRYMKSDTDFNLPALQEWIQDYIVKALIALPLDKKAKVLTYLDDVHMMNGAPSDDGDMAMSDFVASIAGDGTSCISELATEIGKNPKIVEALKNARSRGDSHFRDAFFNALKSLIAIEAKSLQKNANPLISGDFCQKLVSQGLTSLFTQQLEKGTEQALQELEKLQKRLQRRLGNFTMLLEGEVFRSELFPEYKAKGFSSHLISKLQGDIEHHITMCNELLERSKALVAAVGGRAEGAITGEFVAAGALGDRALTEPQQKRQRAMTAETEELKNAFSKLKALALGETLPAEGETLPAAGAGTTAAPETQFFDKFSRTSIRSFAGELDKKRRSPLFYANYVRSLLVEKTDAGHYFVGDDPAVQDEVDYVFSSVFGWPGLGLLGLGAEDKAAFVVALNRLRSAPINQSEYRWSVLDTKLRRLGINWDDKQYSTNPNKIKRVEVACYKDIGAPDDRLQLLVHSDDSAKMTAQGVAKEDQPFHYLRKTSKLSLLGELRDGRVSFNPLNSVKWQGAVSLICTAFADNPGVLRPLVENFVLDTVMSNLNLDDMPKEASDVIRQITQTYLGTDHYNYFPVPFAFNLSQDDILRTSMDTRVSNLVKHLSVMLTTLSDPALKEAFLSGTLRLTSRNKAIGELRESSSDSSYVFRLSNSNPSNVSLTHSPFLSEDGVNYACESTTIEADESIPYSLYNANGEEFSFQWKRFKASELISKIEATLPRRTGLVSKDAVVLPTRVERPAPSGGYTGLYASDAEETSAHFAGASATQLPQAERQRAFMQDYRQRALDEYSGRAAIRANDFVGIRVPEVDRAAPTPAPLVTTGAGAAALGTAAPTATAGVKPVAVAGASPTYSTLVFTGLGGVLTKVPDHSCAASSFYNSTKKDGRFKSSRQIQELFQAEFGNYPDDISKGDRRYLVTDAALHFLREMLQREGVIVSIVSTLEERYIKELLKFQGIPDSALRNLKIGQWDTRKSEAVKASVKDIKVKSGVKFVLVCDEDENDCKSMLGAVNRSKADFSSDVNIEAHYVGLDAFPWSHYVDRLGTSAPSVTSGAGAVVAPKSTSSAAKPVTVVSGGAPSSAAASTSAGRGDTLPSTALKVAVQSGASSAAPRSAVPGDTLPPTDPKVAVQSGALSADPRGSASTPGVVPQSTSPATKITAAGTPSSSASAAPIDVKRVCQLFISYFGKNREKTNSTGIKTLLKYMQKPNITVDDLEGKMQEIGKQRQNRGWSNANVFHKGRDTKVVQPLYNLMAEPEFGLNEDTVARIEKLMNPRVKQVATSLITKEELGRLLASFKEKFQHANKTNSTGIKKMIRAMEEVSTEANPNMEKLSLALKTIAQDRQKGGLSSGLSKVALFGKGRDKTLVQPLYNLMSDKDFKLTKDSFEEIQAILTGATSQLKP